MKAEIIFNMKQPIIWVLSIVAMKLRDVRNDVGADNIAVITS
jgi:hypothetical protein